MRSTKFERVGITIIKRSAVYISRDRLYVSGLMGATRTLK